MSHELVVGEKLELMRAKMFSLRRLRAYLPLALLLPLIYAIVFPHIFR